MNLFNCRLLCERVCLRDDDDDDVQWFMVENSIFVYTGVSVRESELKVEVE